MEILAHRGLWNQDNEQNTVEALIGALKAGYGIETDVRDYKGRLVISHNIADNRCPEFSELLTQYKVNQCKGNIAINIKADGLQKMLQEELETYSVKNYFVFDMSIPEEVVYIQRHFNVFSRCSEYEKNIVLYEKVCGIWLDSFSENWITEDIIRKFLKEGKKLGIISPEIHRRGQEELWEVLKKVNSDKIMLCTDLPAKAKEYFYE